MLRLLLNTVLWLLSFVALYILCLWVFSDYRFKNQVPNLRHYKVADWGHTFQRFQELEYAQNIDILFLGSSHVYRGFDPRVFNKYQVRSFNMGSSNQTPMNSFYLLEDYMEALQPRILVMDVYWGSMRNHNGGEAALDLASNREATPNMVKMVMNTKDPLIINSVFYNYVQRWNKPLYRIRQRPVARNYYVTGGYVENDYEGYQEDNSRKVYYQAAQSHPDQLNYLQKIIDLAQSYNTQVVLVVAPVSEKILKKTSRMSVFDREMDEFADKNGIKYVNFNSIHFRDLSCMDLEGKFEKEIELQKTFDNRNLLCLDQKEDFYDPDHMTQSGVEKFNEQLIRMLKDAGYDEYLKY